jgi:Mrp family chromosome partitioning ATPase
VSQSQIDPALSRTPSGGPLEASPSVESRLRDRALSRLLSPGHRSFEPFRVLRSQVKALGSPATSRCLALVGGSEGEGTSTVALGLATALAQEPGRRVLLLDADLRAPAIEAKLGLPPAPGLAEWLASGGEGPVPVRMVTPFGFSVLAAGTPDPTLAERLGTQTMARLLAAARYAFDFVLLDCPALTTAADAVVLQDLVDGLLLVVRARHASRDTLRRALAGLRPGAIQGVVFNDRTEILSRWLERRHPRSR